MYWDNLFDGYSESENIIQRIPNELDWKPFKSKKLGSDQPPFDPLTVQMIYNYSSNCVEEIISGGNHMQKDWESKCKSCL